MRGADRPQGKSYSQNRADARWEGEGGSQEEANQETTGENGPASDETEPSDVPPTGVEPATYGTGNRRSIH